MTEIPSILRRTREMIAESPLGPRPTTISTTKPVTTAQADPYGDFARPVDREEVEKSTVEAGRDPYEDFARPIRADMDTGYWSQRPNFADAGVPAAGGPGAFLTNAEQHRTNVHLGTAAMQEAEGLRTQAAEERAAYDAFVPLVQDPRALAEALRQIQNGDGGPLLEGFPVDLYRRLTGGTVSPSGLTTGGDPRAIDQAIAELEQGRIPAVIADQMNEANRRFLQANGRLIDNYSLQDKLRRASLGEGEAATQTGWGQVVNNGFHAVGSVLAQGARGVGLIADGLAEIVRGEEITPNALTAAGEWLQERLNEYLPDDPYQNGFIADLSSGVGSMMGFIVGGMATKALGRTLGVGDRAARNIGIGTVGGGAQGASQYDMAVEADATLMNRYVSLLAGFGLGASELAPIDRILGRAEEMTGGVISRALRGGIAGAGEEGLQEMFQAVGADAVQMLVNDPEHQIDWSGAAGQALIGALIGAGMGGLSAAAQGRTVTIDELAALLGAPALADNGVGIVPTRPAPPATTTPGGPIFPVTPATPAPTQVRPPVPAAGKPPTPGAPPAPPPGPGPAGAPVATGPKPAPAAPPPAAPVAPVAGGAGAKVPVGPGVLATPGGPGVAPAATVLPANEQETAILTQFGYEPQQIAEMDPAARAQAVEDAIASGIRPPPPVQQNPRVAPAPESGTTQAQTAPSPQAEAVRAAEQAVNPQPTEAQAKAGNYQKGHVRLNGLDISIETATGGQRSGMGANGERWFSNNPLAAYGYIRRTTGADGEQVDAYIGQNPDSDVVFVVDQIDPATGKFDEHKAILGATSLEEAKAIYEAGFSDGSGAARAGGVTQMSVPEFKDWLNSGDTRKPVTGQIPERPRPRVLGTRPARPSDNLLDFIADQGGLKAHPDLSTIGADRVIRPGRGRIVGPGGKLDLDQMRERVAEAGYFEGTQSGAMGRTTPADLLDLIDDAIRKQGGEAPLTPDAQEREAARQDKRKQVAHRDRVEGDVLAFMQAEGIDDPEWHKAAVKVVLESGMGPELTDDDLVIALERAAINLIPEGKRSAVRARVPWIEDQSPAVSGGGAGGGPAGEVRPVAGADGAKVPADRPAEGQPAGAAESDPYADIAKIFEEKPTRPAPGKVGEAKIGRTQKSLGTNSRGEEVLEDQNGIRSVRAEGTRIDEPVQMQPTKEGMVMRPRTPRDERFEPKEKTDAVPAAKPSAPAPQDAPARPDTDAGGLPGRSKPRPDAGVKVGVREDSGNKKLDAGEGVPDDGKAGDPIARLADQFLAGDGFKTIVQARAAAHKAGVEGDNKAIDEAIELAVVIAARKIVATGGTPRAIFDSLVDLYNRQPKLTQRTSGSMADQAYSTPVPLAYIASRLAGVADAARNGSAILEPTAGNGALLLEWPTNTPGAIVNEINDARAGNLRRLGFKKVLQKDATADDAFQTPNENTARYGAKAVVANPPFGAVREGGESKEWTVDGDYRTTNIDFAIAFNALRFMKDDGTAVLIVGGVNPKDDRQEGYRTQSKRKFYTRLYGKYNVVDHFTVAGDLYSRQGASWPVDVIVISGRGKSERGLPASDVPKLFNTWADLKEKLNERSAPSDTARPAVGHSGGSVRRPVDPDAAGPAPAGRPGGDRPAGGSGDAAGRPPAPVAVPAPPASQRDPDREPPASGKGGAGDGGVRPQDGGDTRGADRPAPVKDEFDSAFDDALDSVFGAGTAAKAPEARASKDADEAIAELAKMFGSGIGMGVGFDPDIYGKVKPLLMKAAAKFREFAGNVAEIVKRIVGEMKVAYKMTAEAIERMRPYLRQFMEDVKAGAIKLVEDQAPKPSPAPVAADQQAAATARAPIESNKDKANTAGQTPYQPQSRRSKGMNTLVPINVRDAIREALNRLEAERGDLDEFVAKELGYEIDEEGPYFVRDGKREHPFGAEQIDALALELDNLKKGGALILGDQTGIGKGRVVAGIIRWAKRNGMMPIFITDKLGLYGDMFRDLTDIGTPADRIVITNTKPAEVPLDDEAILWTAEKEEAIANGDEVPERVGKFFDGATPAQTQAILNQIADGKDVADAVFTTYDQMNSVEGKTTYRRLFLEKVADRILIAADEAHKAAGQGEEMRLDKSKAPPRAIWLRAILKKAKGVLYASATYAKRPEVMDLYNRTNMTKAVDNPKMLPTLIERGGVPLQQVLAGMLARDGQYLRRERSFEGVSYDILPVPVDPDLYASFTRALNTIFEFDLAIADYGADENEGDGFRDTWAQDYLDSIGAAQARDDGIGEGGANSTSFGSIMHNLIGQMLLAIKADQSATEAINAVKAGEKPVITVANTMESFLKDYIEEHNAPSEVKQGEAPKPRLEVGSAIDLSFKDVLHRYLKRTRRITIKDADDKKKKKHVFIPIEDMPIELQEMYAAAEETIQNAEIGALPVSPIDHLRERFRQAGLTISEITGRKDIVDYSGDKPRWAKRPRKELGAAGSRVTVRAFNNGDIDAVILNQSGATGISMHASPKTGKDLRRRRMFILQADANIDVFMQLLGRVHRTGQVIPPAFSQAVAEIPAEARPAAALMKKMASLNANTTGARKSVFSGDHPDFLNQYGDRIVAAILHEDWETNDALGSPLRYDEKGKPQAADVARKALGRIVRLLPEDRLGGAMSQRELLDQIETLYTALIEQLDALGTNMLEAKTVDLQAKTIKSTTVREAKGPGVFEQAAQFEEVTAKASGRAMPFPEVVKAAAEGAGIPTPPRQESPYDNRPGRAEERQLETILNAGRITVQQKIDAAAIAGQSWINDQMIRLKDVAAKTRARAQYDATLDRFRATLNTAIPGARVTLHADNDASTPAVVTKVERHKKDGNPVALSSWSVTFAVPETARTLVVPLSQLYPPGVAKGKDDPGFEVTPPEWTDTLPALVKAFAEANKEGREKRVLMTGNILSGFDAAKGQGQVIQYTTDTGEIKAGILMPRDFSVEEFMSTRAVRLPSGKAVREFLERSMNGEVTSTDGYIKILRYGQTVFMIEISAARIRGGRYFLEEAVRKAAGGEFEKKGSKMERRVDARQLENTVNEMIKLDAVFETTEDQEIAEATAAAAKGSEPTRAASAPGWEAIEAGPEQQPSPPPPPPEPDVVERVINDVKAMVGRIAGRKFKPVQFVEGMTAASEKLGLGGYVQRGGDKLHGLYGQYRYDGTAAFIKIALDTIGTHYDPKISAAHEAWHHVEMALLTEEEREMLRLHMPALRAIAEAEMGRDLSRLPGEEITAIAFQAYMRKRMTGADAGRGFHIAVRRIFEMLARLMVEVRKLLGARGYTSADQLFAAAARGDFANRAPQTNMDKVKAEHAGTALAAREASADGRAALIVRRGRHVGASPRARSYLGQRAARFMRKVSVGSDIIRVKVQDSFLMWRRMQELIERDIGMKLPGHLQVYMVESLFPGRAGERLADLKSKHLEPLAAKMREFGIDSDKLGMFLRARHAEERNREIKTIDPSNDAGSGLTDAEAQAELAAVAGQRAQYDALAAMVDAVTKETRDLLVRSGLLSRDMADAWEAKYKFYVPLRGEEDPADESDPDGPRAGRGYDIRGPEAFRALGRFSVSDNPLGYVLMQAEQAIIRAEKNRVMRAVANLVRAHPKPGLWKIVKSVEERYIDERTGLVKSHWVAPGFSSKARNNPLMHAYKVNGKAVWIEFSGDTGKLLSKALHGTGREHGVVMRYAMRLMRAFSMMATTLNPNFFLPNVIRDLTTAVANISDLEQKPAGIRRKLIADAITIKTIRAVMKEIKNPTSSPAAGTLAAYAREWRLAGGKTSWVSLDNVSQLKGEIDRLFKGGKIRAGLKASLAAFDNLSSALENGTRLSAYVYLRRNGVSADKAASVARELTVNFNRKGEWGSVINTLYMFFNASIQGTFRMAKALKHRSVQRLAVGMVATGVIMDILNYAIADDDDEGQNAYDAIPDYVRERNLIVMLGGSSYLTIPLPWGYNLFFRMGQEISAVMRGHHDPVDAGAGVLATALAAFNPMGTSPSFLQFISPTLTDPIVQLGVENMSWTGGQILPERFPSQEHTPDSQLYWQDTPQAYIDIARMLNQVSGGSIGRAGMVDISPETIEHMMDFLGSGAWRFLEQVWNTGAQLIAGDGLPEIGDLPIVNRFAGSGNAVSSLRHAFWETWDDIDAAHHEAKALRDANERDAFRAVQTQYRTELSVYGAFNDARSALGDVRDQRAALEGNDRITAEERQRRLDELEARERDILRRVLEIYANARRQSDARTEAQ